MATEVILPKVDMDMESAVIAAWHVSAGDTVAEGDAIFDIETDKAGMEVESPADGVIAHISAQAGDEIAVGSVIAWIYAEGEDIPDEAPGGSGQDESAAGDETADEAEEAEKDAEPAERPAAAETPSVPDGERGASERAAAADTGDKTRATPAARSAARERGLDLASVAGSGPRGRVHAGDVEQAGPAGAAASAQSGPAADWAPQEGGLKIGRRRGRRDGAPIVLIHGFTADAMNWSLVEQALGGDREIIRIELPSHGQSPRKQIARYADLVTHVLDAFDSLALTDGAHVVGHSLGGAVAASVADMRSAEVHSLTLIAPAGLGPEIDHEIIEGILRASRTESLAPWLQQLAGDPAAISYDFAQAAMAARMDPALRAAQSAMADALFADGTQCFDIRHTLARLDMPLRVVWGRRDQVIPWRHVLALPDRAVIQLLAEAGHVPPIEMPEACARAIEQSLAVAEAGQHAD